MNVIGVRSMIEFAKTLDTIKAFVHISTAYSQTNRYGMVWCGIVWYGMGVRK